MHMYTRHEFGPSSRQCLFATPVPNHYHDKADLSLIGTLRTNFSVIQIKVQMSTYESIFLQQDYFKI